VVWSNPGSHDYDLTLVDGYDNHACGSPPSPPDSPDGAMYVLGDVSVLNWPTVDLNNLQLYYGGTLTQDGTFLNGTPIPFKKTIYGDFDGDCLVTGADVTLLSDFLGSAAGRCDWPMADWNGDCVVDLVDLTEVMYRSTIGFLPNPECNPQESIVCPIQELLGGGAPEGGQPASAEAIAAFSDAMVDFIASQDPVGDQETTEMTAAANSLGRIAMSGFSREQRTALADALDAARDTYRNDTTHRLADDLARSLRE
jgi:hypothetical protein